MTADIDLADSIATKEIHDITGSYQRFDLFRLEVDQRRQEPIRLLSDAPADRAVSTVPTDPTAGPTATPTVGPESNTSGDGGRDRGHPVDTT